MLLCLNPPLNEVFGKHDLEKQFWCSFGDSIVPVRFVQAGVIKCNAPPHLAAGFVPLTLMRNGDSIAGGPTIE